MSTSVRDYSQFGEQQVLADLFGARLGSFCEVGAYNGVDYSNTRALMLAGWEGVCVEPAPDMCGYLRDAVAGYPVAVVEAACVARDGKPWPATVALRWTRGQPFSTTNPRVGLETGGEEIEVAAITPAEVVGMMAGRPRPWLLSLDTEGTTLGLLAFFAVLARWDAIVVEAHEALPDERAVAYALLGYNRYAVLHQNPVNVIAYDCS